MAKALEDGQDDPVALSALSLQHAPHALGPWSINDLSRQHRVLRLRDRQQPHATFSKSNPASTFENIMVVECVAERKELVVTHQHCPDRPYLELQIPEDAEVVRFIECSFVGRDQGKSMHRK